MRARHFFTVTVVTALLLCNSAVAQNKKEQREIKKLANNACDCTEKIQPGITKDEILEGINSCIYTAIMGAQMKDFMDDLKDVRKLLNEAKMNVKDGDTTYVVSNESKNIIVADKNFREIQDYMMKECKWAKKLFFSNDVKSDKSMSENPEALKYYNKGVEYDGKEKHDKAIESYKKAIAIDPEFAFAWDNMGLSYRKAGNYEEAIKCYRKSLEIDPYGISPLQNLAVAYSYINEHTMAADTYMKLIAMNSSDPEGYYGAGRAFYFAGDVEKGCDYMFQAYKIYSEAKSPYLKDAESMLGAFYNDLKEKGKEQVFKDAAKKNNIELN